MKDVGVGDKITDPTTGGVSTVVAIHPHPPMPIWKFTFDDGASLEVGEDHLWAYRVSNRQRPGTKFSSEREYGRSELNSPVNSSKWVNYRVGSTGELLDILKTKKGTGIRIPLTEPVIFTPARWKRGGIDPYLAGLLLGDGHLDDATITTSDEEIIEYLKGHGFNRSAQKKNSTAYNCRSCMPNRRKVRAWLANHNLLKCRSWGKFIPCYLKYGMLEERLELLRGLMDTDGTVDDRGRVYFDSTSRRLAEDVQWIVRSIGGKARLRIRHTKFTGSNGESKDGRESYQIRIWHPKTSALFKLTRKKARCTDSWNGGLELSRQLVSAKYVGEKEAQCITVSSPYGLYLGDDFVVTHNSLGLIAWMIGGDPDLSEDDPARVSFLNDPDFRGLFLRERYQDMRDFVEEAIEFYRPFGCRPVDDPVILTFASGAKIYTDHLGSEEAYNKYRGWNIVRIGIEELTRIKKLSQYIRLFGSLRSVPRVRGGKIYPKLRTQIASTSNPDGPGAPFVTSRFIDVYSGGQLVPWNTPMQDPVTKLWRIFIPAGLRDNPYLANNAEYWGMLKSQDPVTQAQWIDGDWHASGGVYFRDYRPHGPLGEQEHTEFPWARHLIESTELKPWWYRWGSGDWGYDHPASFHKFCKNDHDGRIHIYDELMLRKVGSVEMGSILANWWAPELDDLPDHQVTIYLSPDAFSLRKAYEEPRTRAEQIESGIKSVLGPYGAFLLHYNEDEIQLAARDEKAAATAFEYRRKQQAGKVCILIRKANAADRLARFAYVRDLLRWRPIVAQTKPDAAHLAALFATKGQAAYEAEIAKYADRKPEVLPKMQVWRVCRELDRCLREMVHDEGPKHEEPMKVDAEDGVGGDDAMDSASFGLFSARDVLAAMPKAYWVAERMQQAQTAHQQATGEQITDVNRLMQIQRQQEALYAKQNPPKGGSVTLPRAGSPRHWK